jgi:hypothetical protein
MFNSVIVDVAIGLTLSFLAVSLAASAITEAISSALKWREKTLLRGVQELLNDADFKGIALDLYNHALVNPLGSGVATSVKTLTRSPAYIDSQQFALAFYSMLGKGETDPDKVIAAIQDPQLKNAMASLWAVSSNNLNSFKNNIAVWFDNSMDRLSGWYKRWTQWVSFLVALAIALLLNVNAFYESAQIWKRPEIISELTAGHFSDNIDSSKADEFKKILDGLDSAYLIGWADGPSPWGHDIKAWTIAVSSWIVVAAATLFGAPFWFDALQRLTNLRGTGLKPEKTDPTPQ